jgi:hypothetical protein
LFNCARSIIGGMVVVGRRVCASTGNSWNELKKAFRVEGFYERFPAKGQVERVGRIHRDLARAIGVEVSGRSAQAELRS